MRIIDEQQLEHVSDLVSDVTPIVPKVFSSWLLWPACKQQFHETMVQQCTEMLFRINNYNQK